MGESGYTDETVKALKKVAKGLKEVSAALEGLSQGPESRRACERMLDKAFREMDDLDVGREVAGLVEEFRLTHDVEELAVACYFKGVEGLSNNLRESLRRMQ